MKGDSVTRLLASRLRARIGDWRRAVLERQQRTDLDCRRLRDLGLTPSDIRLRVVGPFWDTCGR